MKKTITVIVLLTLCLIAFISCDIEIPSNIDPIDSATNTETTEQTASVSDSIGMETEKASSAEETIEKITEEPTEEVTEEPTEKVTEEETEPPIPCSHDYPQDAVDQLIAEGQDVEQLKFQKGPDLHFQYVVILNKRILRHGEQLQISTVHLASGFDVIDIKELYDFFHEGNMSPLMLRSASNQLIPIDLVDTPYGWKFIFTVPDDMEPGVYRLELDLRNENYIVLCKIVIY